jgi:hypothetical protein
VDGEHLRSPSWIFRHRKIRLSNCFFLGCASFDFVQYGNTIGGVMELGGEPIKEKSDRTGVEGIGDGSPIPRREALREWAKRVEQDSQAETFEYLGESVTKHSGE